MISLIVAVAENGVIGDRNALLWHISEDLRHFKAVTTGHPVVMGRKTWESLGRPLPNRTNVVITRQNIEIPGCTVVHSLEEAVALFPADEEVFVIGGAQIYAAALPLARKFYLTRVFRAYEGDTRFPAGGTSANGGWCRRSRSPAGKITPGRLPSSFTNGAKLRIYTTARPPRIPYLCTAKVFFVY